MSTYTETYTETYGGDFPANPLDVMVELDLAGSWTDITTFAYQRDGTSPPITIARGRPDETSQATPSTCGMQWDNRDGRFSPRNPTGPYYGALGRNTPLRVSVPDASTYLRFADDDTSYASCPDSDALQLTEDMDVRIDLDLDNSMPALLAAKWGATATAWALSLNGDGTVTWTWYDGTDVNTAQSTVPIPLGRSMVRVFFNAAYEDGPAVTFWTAPSMAGSQSQLGQAVPVTLNDFAVSGAGQAVSVGYSATWDTSYGQAGLQGKVYELQVYNGSETLVADPQFFGEDAGATSFADGQGNVWTLAGSASLSARSFRGHFECSSLPQLWDPTGSDIWTPVSASGVLRRLQQGNAPVWSTMKRGITAWPSGPSDVSSLTAPPATIAYWPCEDPQGATVIAAGIAQNSDGATVSPMSFSGAPGFQGQSGSPSADSTFACSAELPQVGTSTWTGAVPGYSTQGVAVAATWLLSIPSGGIGEDCTLVSLNFGAGWQLTLDYSTAAGGTLSVGGFATIAGPAEMNGLGLLVQVANVATGAEAWLSVLPLGDPASGALVYSAVSDSGQLRTITVNPSGVDLGETEMGQFWVTCAYQSGGGDIPAGLPTVADMANLLNAWSGETAASRVVRLCGENNLAGRVYGYPGNSAIMGDQTIDTLANLLQYCETSDRGLLYEPSEALGIGYRTLGSLGNQSPSAQLDYTQAHLGGDGSQGLQPVDDDQYTINDATVSRNNGSSVQVQVTTGPLSILPPPDGVGDYATQVTVYTAYDTSLPHIAGWITHIGTADEERYPSIPLNLARPQLSGLVYALQDVRIGDYVQVIDPPAWLPPGPIDQLVYGSTEKLGGYWWEMAWNAVPETPYEVAIAGTGASDSAHADTAGSQLAAGVSATATSLSVTTTQGPIWTTNGGAGSGQQAIVPLYSYPPSGFWSDVTANAPTMGMIICNVDNGPGTGYESNFGAVFSAAAAAGITCLGYVPTGYGADTIASIEAQIDLWQTYYGLVSIMFDTVSPDSGYLTYYTELVEYVHARGGICVLNPGTIPAEGYMSIGADVIQVCEDSQANFATDAAAAPSWLFDYPTTSIAVTCNECSTEADMAAVVGLSQSAFNAHYCWVTSDGIYNVEPSYFADEVTELGYAPGGGGDFPFDIQVGGEQITVMDITGDSSPQPFSVIRSVNGVVKAHAESASVALFHTPIAALA